MSLQLTEGNFFGNLEKQKEYSFFRCNITTYEPGQDIEEHSHENSYLSLLVKGGYQETNYGNRKVVNAGKMIFRPSGYSHSNQFGTAGGVCLNIEFKKELPGSLEYLLKLPKEVSWFNAGVFPSPYKLLYCFVNSVNEELYEDFIIEGICEMNHDPCFSSSLPWIDRVVKILHSESDVRHTLHAIAERVYVHPVYLSRAFKTQTGFTISEYQLKIKLQKSIDLLFNSNMPVHEVAFECGFCDAAHFINSFRLLYHVSPAKFRSSLKS